MLCQSSEHVSVYFFDLDGIADRHTGFLELLVHSSAALCLYDVYQWLICV